MPRDLDITWDISTGETTYDRTVANYVKRGETLTISVSIESNGATSTSIPANTIATLKQVNTYGTTLCRWTGFAQVGATNVFTASATVNSAAVTDLLGTGTEMVNCVFDFAGDGVNESDTIAVVLKNNVTRDDDTAPNALMTRNDFIVTNGTGLLVDVGAGILSSGASVAAQTSIALSNNTTNYIELSSAGVASKNTTGFTDGYSPLAVVVTASGAITTNADRRPWIETKGATGGSITVNSTVTTGFTAGRILYSDGSVVQQYSISGTGSVAMTNSPEFTTGITTQSVTFNLLNTTATTVNFAGAATSIVAGASTVVFSLGGNDARYGWAGSTYRIATDGVYYSATEPVFKWISNSLTPANNLLVRAVGTGNPVIIEAEGTDANIGIDILPKGAGTVNIVGPATATSLNGNTITTGTGTLTLGTYTLTVPATGTAALRDVANTFTAANTISTAGANSTPPLLLSGVLNVGGTGTTTFPHLFHQPTGATAATTWSTGANNGTVFGANEATGFTGNFVDFKIAGAATSAFKVASTGAVTAPSITTNTGNVLTLIATSDVVASAGKFRAGTQTNCVAALEGQSTGEQLRLQYSSGNDARFQVGSTGLLTITNTGSGAATKITGATTVLSGTAIPAGGTAGAGIMVSSTANFGVFFGSGAPTLSAAKGSLYLRSDGSGTGDRMYVNHDGSTGWYPVTTSA